MTDEVEVTDEDVVAASVVERASWLPNNHPTVQAFARHRIASQPLSSDIEAERLLAWADVQAERKRQIESEGWTPAHDDEHDDAELLAAALCYAQSALGAASKPPFRLDEPPVLWPWDAAWWKPANPRRDLVRAAALILAEIERIDRAAALKETPNVG